MRRQWRSTSWRSIAGWDEEDFFIYVNGTAINLGTFNWRSDEAGTSFTVGDVTVTRADAVDIANYGDAGRTHSAWLNDNLHGFELTVSNVGTTLEFGFGSSLSSAAWNESWGIDNLTITADEFQFV